jgi:hypothetical protein
VRTQTKMLFQCVFPPDRAHVNEAARDVARALVKIEAFERSRRDRKRVEMLFAHVKRMLRLGRLRLRGPCGAQTVAERKD